MFRTIILIIAIVIFGGCGPSASQRRDAQAAESARKAEQQAAIERQQREQTETRLREQETRTSRWQFTTVLGVSLAGITLIVGTILGSRARHDAEQ